MSTSVDTSFVTQYEAEVKHVFQREGSMLKGSVRMKMDVRGSTAVFNRVGKGTATTKSRHGTITPMNQTHAAPSCTLEDFYAGDWVDKLDEAKLLLNERDVIAKGGAMALGRKVDDQITTVLGTTTQTGVTITSTSKATVIATLTEACEAAWDNDVPNDGEVYGIVTPRLWSQMSQTDQFASRDYRNRMVGEDGPAIDGWTQWNNVKWKMHTGLPNKGTSTANAYVYHKMSVAYAVAESAGNMAGNDSIAADITWHGDRAAHFVNHMMSGQACMIDDTGVIELTTNDNAAIVTS